VHFQCGFLLYHIAELGPGFIEGRRWGFFRFEPVKSETHFDELCLIMRVSRLECLENLVS